MRVQCRLAELAAARGLAIKTLAQRTGLDRGLLNKLSDGRWKSIKRPAIARLLEVLDADLDELFVAFDDDIWTPIRLGRELTIHFGSNSLPEVAPDRSTRKGPALRESIGYWDLRAYFAIAEYVSRLGGVAALRFRAHPTDAPDEGAVDEVFRDGNHIIIGSPIANTAAEGVVSKAFGVPPKAASQHNMFPYNFVWDRRVKGVSSFGVKAQGKDRMGIISTKTGKLVAQRTLVGHDSEDVGKDCALIVTYRLDGAREGARSRRESPMRDGQRIIIAILGHSGPGTLAGAEILVDPKHRGELYPAVPNQARMRVVGADYVRQAPGARDSRTVTHRWLEPEQT